jgi:hypothetical protein
MEQQYVTLLAGLGGALIGAAASIATVTVQAHYQARRERMRVAVDAGIEDYKGALELAKLHAGPVQLSPLSAYIHFHAEMLGALEAGPMSPEALREIYRRYGEVRKVIREATDERTANQSSPPG